MLNVELGGKRLEILKEVVPALTQVFVLWNPANHGNAMIMDNTRATASILKLRLHSIETKTARELDDGLRRLSGGRGNALSVVEDPITLDQRQKIADFAAKRTLPGIYGFAQFVDAGGLLSYGIRIEDLFHRAAAYVDKVLKGTKPADLPVEQPTKFEFIINLKAAKQIGLTIPPNVLARADRVIK
jgi:putative ABC transport system substrate-binding protein